MSHVIAVAGKGGVGKTTLCGLLIQYLCEQKKGPILAVDADANSNLNEVLGVEVEATLGDIREEIARAETAKENPIPAGVSKADYAEFKFNSALIEDDDFRKKVAECKADMENGTDIAEALVKAGIFTGVYARMTSIAGKAGMMDEMMGRIADECEEEVDEKLSSMIAVLEPTLVIILSVIVGTILLSVMLPLLGIMSGL